MELLILLIESRGQLVARSEIVDRLWGKDVFVDVETGVNTAISKIRQALRESPDAPVFLETIPGKGYRFTSDVEASSTAAESSSVNGSAFLNAATCGKGSRSLSNAAPLRVLERRFGKAAFRLRQSLIDSMSERRMESSVQVRGPSKEPV